MMGKKVNKVGRRLIRISTAEGKWQGNWNADYNFTLRDLQLDDLVEVGDPRNARIFITLTIHKHAGFGLSVDGTIDTSFTRKCSNCSLPYCRQETCSDVCDKPELGLKQISKAKAPTVDKRWSKLLELKSLYQ